MNASPIEGWGSAAVHVARASVAGPPFSIARRDRPSSWIVERGGGRPRDASTTATPVSRRKSAASFAFAVRAAVANKAVMASLGSGEPGRP